MKTHKILLILILACCSFISSCQKKKEQKNPTDIDETEVSALIEQAILKLKNEIRWGKNGRFAVADQFKVKKLGRMGAGTGFKAVNYLSLNKVGIYDENKKRFVVEVSYMVSNRGENNIGAPDTNARNNIEYYIYLDDYGERYAVLK